MFSLLILAPLFCVILLNLPLGRMRKSAFWAALVLLVAQTAMSALPVLRGAFAAAPDTYGRFLNINFAVDNLSFVVLFCIGTVMLAALLTAPAAIKGEKQRFNFINLLLLALAGLNGVVMAADIFSIYVFLEITTITSFILIAFDQEKEALEGAFKYIILSAVASALILSSIAFFVFLSGGMEISAVRAYLKAPGHDLLAVLAASFLICGLLIKGGLMPFHGWLPDVYTAAPAPVSALLAGVVTKTLGIYPLLRIFGNDLGFDSRIKAILFAVGFVSIVAGALAAMGQTDFKRMLAYSSISQVGYIAAGLGCGTWLGFLGAAFHFLNHSMFKTLLFVNSAAVELKTGVRDMNKLGGLAAKMPITGATSVLAALSAAGVPPLAGFWSKLIVIIALWMAGYYALAVTAALVSVITLAYLLSMQRRVFFGKLPSIADGDQGIDFSNIKESGAGLTAASVALALIIVAIGVGFPFLFRFSK